MEIRYDVTDWKQQYDANSAVRPSSADDAIELMRESDARVSDLALSLIVGRELGEVQDASLPTNKLANLLGMSNHLTNYRARQTAKVNIAGKEQNVPRYVANATIDAGVETGFEFTTPNGNPPTTVVDYNDPAAADRAIAYLMTNVIGRIRDRLKLVALNKPDELSKVVKNLKKTIDDIARDLR